MLAVSEHLWGQTNKTLQRVSTAFAGGVGSTHEELCGALSGGVMVISALHGRVHPHEDNTRCKALAARYRTRFIETFGATRCQTLRDSGYGSGGSEPCAVLAKRATHILLEILQNND